MSKYDTSSSSDLSQQLKTRYKQKDYDTIPRKSSINYYLGVLVKYRLFDNNLTYLNIDELNPDEPMFVGSSHIRKNIDAIIDLKYRPNATFNILLRLCYTPKRNGIPPYFQLSLLVYIFHTIIKKNTTQLTELFISQFDRIKYYLVESCYGNNDRKVIVYRPIEIAAFYGNVDAFKHLISNGAKYDKLNTLNESIRDILHAGLTRLNSSSDELTIFFLRDSFTSCLDFLELTEKSMINKSSIE